MMCVDLCYVVSLVAIAIHYAVVSRGRRHQKTEQATPDGAAREIRLTSLEKMLDGGILTKHSGIMCTSCPLHETFMADKCLQ